MPRARLYFANPRSSDGGQLDLDSNPACRIDGVNQEVITWPLGRASAGEYKIEVDEPGRTPRERAVLRAMS